jgi:hypothetical protein
MEIKIATEEEIKYCYKIMHQIREDLNEVDFLSMISKQLKDGYKVVYVTHDKEVICVAGFTICHKLAWGKHLFIEDFITDKSVKSIDAAKALLDFVKIYAKQQKCTSIHLDSSIERKEAHKFYLKEDMKIDSYHFSFKI